MIDKLTKRPISVSIDENGVARILVQRDQFRDVTEVLCECCDGVGYTVNQGVIHRDGSPLADEIELANAKDAQRVQRALDNVNVKVSMNMVNGDYNEYFESEAIVTELRRLRDVDGLKGKHLFEELFSDDWGAPPLGASIEGHMRDGTPVKEYVPYG